MAEKVDEFVRSENVLDTMDKRTVKKQKSRLQSKDELEAPKYKYAPPPPPLPPPPTPAANLPIKVRRDGEQAVVERPPGDWSDWTEELKQRRTTLRKERNSTLAPGVSFRNICRKADSQERSERKKAVQEMNEGELLTALREKLKNIEASGETFIFPY